MIFQQHDLMTRIQRVVNYIILAVTHVLHTVDSCLKILGLFLCLWIIKCYKVRIPYTYAK